MFKKRLYEIADKINEDYSPTYWSNRGKYQKEYEDLWDKLVPGLGEADTEAGELIRSISKIYYDLYNNGFGNGPFKDEWEFVKFNDEFKRHVDREALETFDKWFTGWIDYGSKIVDSGFHSDPDEADNKIMKSLDKIVDATVLAAMELQQQNEEKELSEAPRRQQIDFATRTTWEGDKGYPYRLALINKSDDGDWADELGEWVVQVQRDFDNNGDWEGTPGRWYYNDVKGMSTLTIDGGLDWTVDVPRKAWKELEDYIRRN